MQCPIIKPIKLKAPPNLTLSSPIPITNSKTIRKLLSKSYSIFSHTTPHVLPDILTMSFHKNISWNSFAMYGPMQDDLSRKRILMSGTILKFCITPRETKTPLILINFWISFRQSVSTSIQMRIEKMLSRVWCITWSIYTTKRCIKNFQGRWSILKILLMTIPESLSSNWFQISPKSTEYQSMLFRSTSLMKRKIISNRRTINRNLSSLIWLSWKSFKFFQNWSIPETSSTFSMKSSMLPLTVFWGMFLWDFR